MERREDSTLTSPYVTPFGRSSMTAVCRGDKTEDEKQSGFSWFLFTPFSNTTVFYAYIILLLLFFAYPFCNSFIPPLTLVQSILFSSSSSYLMADGFVVGAALFCHLILRGRASENDMAADWREGRCRETTECLVEGTKPSEYLPESIRADSPAWLTSLVATPKRTPLYDGCRL